MKPDFYELLADDYDRMVDTPARLEREVPPLVSRLREAGAQRVIEVGCATGRHAAALGREGFKVLGLDPSPRFITLARSQPNLPDTVAFAQSTLDQWAPKVVEPFDALLCLGHTLPHLVALRPLASVFEIMAHTLRPGGLVLFQMINPAQVERRRVWTPPVRSWTDGETQITLMRQWVDADSALQLVVTRFTTPIQGRAVVRSCDRAIVPASERPSVPACERAFDSLSPIPYPLSPHAIASTWDQHLPKIRPDDLRRAFDRGHWTEVLITSGWDTQDFDEATAETIIATAHRPLPAEGIGDRG
jgi:SAM-dependent methyltransferase